MNSSKKLITITGASGSGKDTLLDAMLYCCGMKSWMDLNPISRSVVNTAIPMYDDMPLRELISHTTRAPRSGEADGVDYYFIDKAAFDALEKIEETQYAGNFYCLSANEVYTLADNEIGAVIVDKHGVECIEKFAAEHDVRLCRIFLKTDEQTSAQRMRTRGDSPAKIEERLKQQAEKDEYSAGIMQFDLILDAADSFYANVKCMGEFMHGYFKS